MTKETADPIISFSKAEQMNMVIGLRLGAYSRIRMVLTASRSDKDKLQRIEQIMESAARDIRIVMARTTHD